MNVNSRNWQDRMTDLLSSFQGPLLLVIRLYWGWQFFEAGRGKFANMAHVVSFFQDLGIPLPALNACIVATVETVGGLLLLIGLASRLAALPLAATMGVAYVTAHLDSVRHIFSDPENFTKQDPFLFLLAVLLVMSFGPGIFSVDYILRKFFRKNS